MRFSTYSASGTLHSLKHSVTADETHKRDRGGGIYIRGDFRLRDFSLTFDRTTGELTDTSFINGADGHLPALA